MHSYLKSIGFSKIDTRKELQSLLNMVMEQPTEKYVTKNNNVINIEIKKDFSERMGIAIRGESSGDGTFTIDHYYPYLKGQISSIREEIAINKRIDTDAYTGMCDDIRLGVSVIFYIQNVIDYMNCCTNGAYSNRSVTVNLSCLALEGSILLGSNQNNEVSHSTINENTKKNKLIADAKKGNQEAIDSLTIDDIDLYAMVSKRVKFEDVYSIVDTTFIPYGSESDNYTIIGNILEVNLNQNSFSKEYIYTLIVECNDIVLEVAINKKYLIGEPVVGRRFKGIIWLQGYVVFND